MKIVAGRWPADAPLARRVDAPHRIAAGNPGRQSGALAQRPVDRRPVETRDIVPDRILTVAGDDIPRLDWSAIDRALSERSGLPTRITRRDSVGSIDPPR